MSLTKIIRKTSAVLVLAFMLAIPAAVPALVNGGPAVVHASTEDVIKQGINQSGGSQNTKSLPVFIQGIVNILLFIIGAISVIMIIVGGIKYVTSAGDSSQISSAKNTVLYAIVGVVIAFMAYAIVGFVVDKL